MYKGIYVGTSGALLGDRRLSAIAHNLANQHTIGFKRERMSFRTYLLGEGAGELQPAPSLYPGSKTLSTMGGLETDLSAGEISQTGNPLDVAITGEGFFAVNTPDGVRYTRRGVFQLNEERTVATSEGYPVLADGGPLTLPEGSTIVIGDDGRVSVDNEEVGTLQIVGLVNPQRNDRGYYIGTPEPIENIRVAQGALEQSNVQSFREMIDMIQTTREYETNMRMIQAFDTASQKTVNELARV